MRNNNFTSSFKTMSSTSSYTSLEEFFDENERLRLINLSLKRDTSPTFSEKSLKNNSNSNSPELQSSILENNNLNILYKQDSFTLYESASLFLPDIGYDYYNNDINDNMCENNKRCKRCNKNINNNKYNEYCSYWCNKKSHEINKNEYEFKCKKCKKMFQTKNIFNDYCSDECFTNK